MAVDPNGIFATNNTNPGGIDVEGTTLQGTIKCTYEDLVHIFGEPIDEETDLAWIIRFNDFTVAKIYLSKTTLEATPPAKYWDINGFDKTAFVRVSTVAQRSLKEAA